MEPRAFQTVAVSRVDGGLTVLRVLEKGEPITPEYVEKIIQKHVDGGNWVGGQLPTSWRMVPNDFVDETTDRTYRNAWVDGSGNKPGHDIIKARDIHRDHLRRTRQRALDTLDVEYQRADEQNDQQLKQSIARQKQKLRDVTADPRIEAAQTVEDLKALTLDVLTT